MFFCVAGFRPGKRGPFNGAQDMPFLSEKGPYSGRPPRDPPCKVTPSLISWERRDGNPKEGETTCRAQTRSAIGWERPTDGLDGRRRKKENESFCPSPGGEELGDFLFRRSEMRSYNFSRRSTHDMLQSRTLLGYVWR